MEISFKSGGQAALWKPNVWPVYLFFGEEDTLKDEAVSALAAHVVSEDFADFDLEKLDAGTASADAILSAAGQIPFGSDRRLVVVRGMESWRERGKSGEVERLADGLTRLADTACLALVAAAEDDEAKRKTAVTVKLDNAVKKIGAIVTCKGLSGDSLIAWIVQRAAQEGKRFQGDAAELLVEWVGSEMRSLEQEIIKLSCYVGERERITSQDVSEIVASSPEDVMFTTVDAITRRQTDRALSLLHDLHRFDPKPQAVAGKLLALLARQYRLLWQAKFLAEKRINPREVRSLSPALAAELPNEGSIALPPMAFRAGDLFAASRNYSWAELTQALDRLLLCDLANKGGATDEIGTFGSDPARNLQLLVLELTGATRARATSR